MSWGDLNANERLAVKADAVAGVVATVLIVAGIALADHFGYINKPHEKEIDPCVIENRGHRVIASGVFAGCTGDPTNYRG